MRSRCLHDAPWKLNAWRIAKKDWPMPTYVPLPFIFGHVPAILNMQNVFTKQIKLSKQHFRHLTNFYNYLFGFYQVLYKSAVFPANWANCHIIRWTSSGKIACHLVLFRFQVFIRSVVQFDNLSDELTKEGVSQSKRRLYTPTLNGRSIRCARRAGSQVGHLSYRCGSHQFLG